MPCAKILKMRLFTVVLVLAFLGIPSAAQRQKPANPQLPDPNSETQPQGPDSAQPASPKTKNEPASEANPPGQVSSETKQTFSGRIVKSKDQFVLKDRSSNNTYKLDRQDIAKQYEGKDVKVAGTLDSSDNTIRVSAIEPLP
jgi:Protein of unknown function (DUF5818)